MVTKRFPIVPLLMTLFCFVNQPLIAQDNEGEGAKDKPSPITAITGGDVYTVTGEIIRGGTVLVQDGKILDVGQDIELPAGATIIDATGKVVSPGFVAISMSGVGIGRAPGDNDQLVDSLDPFDRNIKYVLGVGITTGCVQLSADGGRRRRGRDGDPEERFLGLEPEPQQLLTQEELDFGDEDTSLCPCCGLPILPTEPITAVPPSEIRPRKHAVLKMSYGNLDPMLVKEHAFYDMTPGGLAGPANRHNWRIEIQKVKEAESRVANAGARAGGESSQRPSRGSGRSRRGSRGGGNEDLQRLVSKEVSLRTQANTVDEIRDMIDLAKELDYNLVIEGALEGWLVASELGKAQVPVIFTPRERREAQAGRPDDSGSSIESTSLFESAGVPFAIAALGSSVSMGGIAGRDLTSLPLEAAFAVRGGASDETALKALTIVPARMLGLEDRIGSIEKGKDADLLILNGPPLDYRTYVETAIVAGNVSYERATDRVYPD